jgi:hypothetical protein
VRSPGPRSPAGVPKAADTAPVPDRDRPAADYERLRAQVLAARPDGWRRGWAVLARRGMAAWITTRAAMDEEAGRHGTAAASPQALPLFTTPMKGGEPSFPACGSLPPAATADIVTVLAAMMLACAS